MYIIIYYKIKYLCAWKMKTTWIFLEFLVKWEVGRKGGKGEELRMVMIHVKSEGDEEKQFLYDCLGSSTIDEIAHGLLDIADLQSHILTLSLHLRRHLLTDHLRGIFHFVACFLWRVWDSWLLGCFPESYPDFSVSLERTLSEAQAYASKVGF